MIEYFALPIIYKYGSG